MKISSPQPNAAQLGVVEHSESISNHQPSDQLPNLPSAQPPPHTSDVITAARLRAQLTARAEKIINRVDAGIAPDQVRMPPAAGDPSWARENEKVAKDALKMVRLALYDKNTGSYKSSNKINLNKHVEELQRIKNAVLGGPKEINNASSNSTKRADLISLLVRDTALMSKNIWESKGVNCRDLAFAVQDYVSHHHPHLQTSILSLDGQHVIAAVGTIQPECARVPLSEWPAHIYLSDPWANIACAAPNYAEKFQEKMKKWELDGKAISNETGTWVLPTDKDSCACVNKVPKILTRRQYENGYAVNLPWETKPAAPTAHVTSVSSTLTY